MIYTPPPDNQGVQFQEALEKYPLQRSDKESTISLIGESPFKDYNCSSSHTTMARFERGGLGRWAQNASNITSEFRGGSIAIGENAGMACALKKHNQEILGGGLSRKIQEEEMNCRRARWDSGRAQAWNSYQPSRTTPSMKLTCPGKLRWTTSVNSNVFGMLKTL